MLSTLFTFLAAIVAVFIMVLAWVTIDRLAHKHLGERNRCCHSFDADSGQAAGGCCGKHESCPLADESDGSDAHPESRR